MVTRSSNRRPRQIRLEPVVRQLPFLVRRQMADIKPPVDIRDADGRAITFAIRGQQIDAGPARQPLADLDVGSKKRVKRPRQRQVRPRVLESPGERRGIGIASRRIGCYGPLASIVRPEPPATRMVLVPPPQAASPTANSDQMMPWPA